MSARTRCCVPVLLVCALLPAVGAPRPRKKKTAPASGFSYYLLVLSYAPDFCSQPGVRKDPRECGPGQRLGFVVHGLWPQGKDSRGPESCGPSSPVSQAIIQATLRYVPTESLIQHEWSTHGTCSGLSAADYFAALRRARDSVKVPPDLDQPSRGLESSPTDVESKMAAANPNFPKTAFRTSCYRDGELNEIRVCVNKDLSPRACGASAGECGAPQVSLLPVR